MSDAQAYLFICAGVVVSVLLPVIKGFVRRQFPPAAPRAMMPPWIKKYGGLLLFGALTGVVVFAVWKSQNPALALQWHTAFLLGFTSEAALEKLIQKP